MPGVLDGAFSIKPGENGADQHSNKEEDQDKAPQGPKAPTIKVISLLSECKRLEQMCIIFPGGYRLDLWSSVDCVASPADNPNNQMSSPWELQILEAGMGGEDAEGRTHAYHGFGRVTEHGPIVPEFPPEEEHLRYA